MVSDGQVMNISLRDIVIIRMLLQTGQYVVKDGFIPCNVMNNENNMKIIFSLNVFWCKKLKKKTFELKLSSNPYINRI